MVSSLLYSFILLEVVIKTQYLLTYSHLSHFMKFNKRKEKRRKGAQGLTVLWTALLRMGTRQRKES